MAKKEKYKMDDLLNGIRTISLSLEVLKYLTEEKEREREWLQKQVKQLKIKENG